MPALTDSHPETQARQLHQRLLDAWNARDAAAYAALIAPDGSVIGFDGSQMNGRGEVEAELRAIFEHHQTSAYVAIVREVRRLADDVELVRAAVGMVPPGQSDINPVVNAVQSLVAVRRAGEWEAALLQNTPAAFHGRPELSAALTDELRAAARAQGSERRVARAR